MNLCDQKVEVKCHYCGSTYEYDFMDIKYRINDDGIPYGISCKKCGKSNNCIYVPVDIKEHIRRNFNGILGMDVKCVRTKYIDRHGYHLCGDINVSPYRRYPSAKFVVTEKSFDKLIPREMYDNLDIPVKTPSKCNIQ